MPGFLIFSTRYFAELKRPWKVTTFAFAMCCLFYGAFNFGFADWDLGLSVLMGVLTYLCAPWTVSVVVACVRRRPRNRVLWLACALFLTWLVVDGSYVAYNEMMGHAMLRADNLITSSSLYLLAGVVWSYPGSLRELATDLRRALTGIS